jgi:hypothetical protein
VIYLFIPNERRGERKSRAIPLLLPLWAFVACSRVNFICIKCREDVEFYVTNYLHCQRVFSRLEKTVSPQLRVFFHYSLVHTLLSYEAKEFLEFMNTHSYIFLILIQVIHILNPTSQVFHLSHVCQ